MNESANTNAQVRFFSKKISFGEKLCIKGQGKRVILPHFFTWPPAKFDHKLHVLISLSVWHACHFYASYLPTRKLENQGRHKKSLLHKEQGKEMFYVLEVFDLWRRLLPSQVGKFKSYTGTQLCLRLYLPQCLIERQFQNTLYFCFLNKKCNFDSFWHFLCNF